VLTGDHRTTGPVGLSRRELLARTAAGLATASIAGLWRPVPGRAATCARPAGFPEGIPLETRTFENWARETIVPDLPFAVPRTSAEVVEIVRWAAAAGWRVRPCGFMHGFSPLVVVPDTTCASKVLLVDTTQHLVGVRVDGDEVVAACGATMDAITLALQQRGLGFTNIPAPGDITIAGALAIDAHGTAVPARGETGRPRHAYGSLSNRVLSLTAIVWDPATRRYAERRFTRAEDAIDVLLTHLGRSFVTEVRLLAEPDDHLRCLSITDVPAAEIFGAPGSSDRTFSSYLDLAGRAEAIWFPYTDKPWLKVWSVSPEKPASSRAVTEPYNYPFADNIPTEVTTLAETLVEGDDAAAEPFGQALYTGSVAGLAATQSGDIWGPSRTVLLYTKPTTLRLTVNGYALICARADVQAVLHKAIGIFGELRDEWASARRHPWHGPIEIRTTGLDHPDVGIPGAEAPQLSALRPRADRPEWDTVVWFDLLAFPGQPGHEVFDAVERRLLAAFDGTHTLARVEWSKGFAYGPDGPWTNAAVLDRTIPASLTTGYDRKAGFAAAANALAEFDPRGVYGNAFLDRLLAPRALPKRRRSRARRRKALARSRRRR